MNTAQEETALGVVIEKANDLNAMVEDAGEQARFHLLAIASTIREVLGDLANIGSLPEVAEDHEEFVRLLRDVHRAHIFGDALSATLRDFNY